MSENLILIAIVALSQAVLIAWKILDKRSEKKNGKVNLEMIPGHSEECEHRGTEITKLAENYKHVVKSISKIDTNIANLWRHVKKNGTN